MHTKHLLTGCSNFDCKVLLFMNQQTWKQSQNIAKVNSGAHASSFPVLSQDKWKGLLREL